MTTVIYSYHISREGILDPGEIIELFAAKGYTFTAIETTSNSTHVNLQFWKPSDTPDVSLPRKQYKPITLEKLESIVHRCKRQRLK